MLAKAIHQASARASKPFIAVNCGAIPEALALVAYGLGVAIVPASAATLAFGAVVFRPLQASSIKSQLVILRSPRRVLDDGLLQMTQLAVAELQSLSIRLKSVVR